MAMSNLADFEAHARDRLNKDVCNFYSAGADQEQTLRDNVEAFKRYRLRPRMLRDVSQLDMRVKLLGEWVEFPICVAPTACHKFIHPDGEIATAQACAKMGTCMVVSTFSTISLEDIVQDAEGHGLRWFQLHAVKDMEVNKELVLRAEKAGYKAIVITVDSPAVGNRSRPVESANLPKNTCPNLPPNYFSASAPSELPEQARIKAMNKRLANLTWETIDWFCSITELPILLKGILTAEDALESVKHNIKGIIVSNHGGRQLDGVPATIDVLPEVMRAVSGRVEVFMDGGVRQGTDVLKALAMGARAVFVGRPVLWGLAYKGREGVEQVLQILKDEFKLAMMLSACAKMGTCMVVSTFSTVSLEDIVQDTEGHGLRWFQLHAVKDMEVNKQLVLRAEKAGYKAIVVTVDAPAVGNRSRPFKIANLPKVASPNNLPPKYFLGSADPGWSEQAHINKRLANLTWETIDWFCSITELPILLKGILTAEDALEAVKHNIKGIIVSNHGGRQLDGVPATIDVLPEVVRAVSGRVEVFMDGGVRQGTDVLKALAMGARAVFVGRPVLWGLAYKGREGVEQVLQILKDEFKLAMMLSGCAKLLDIKPEIVVHESYYKCPRVQQN